MITNTIALNVNHSRIQQYHIKFCYFDKKKIGFIDNTKGDDKMKKIPKRKKGLDWILFLRITLLHNV